jgi:hypothetical protein
MNLVGHVAVALEPDAPSESTDFLVGCMLPDLAAIARVRLVRPDGELGRGVEFHHACDAVFHESDWFRTANRELRDELLGAGVDTGPARACSHAGVEMLLDGALVERPEVRHAAARAFAAVDAQADVLAALAPRESRAITALRFRRIATSLDPTRYRDARFVAERLHAMTAGRRRIELPAAHVDRVADALHDAQPRVAAAAPSVLAAVRG